MKLKLIAAAASLLLLVGCWTEKDDIRIKADGSTTFQTEVTITDEKMSVDEVEKSSDSYKDILTKAGWTVEKKWLSKSKPFRLKYTGSGNLATVKSCQDLYSITKVDEKRYRFYFFSGPPVNGKPTRSITFNKGLTGGAKIVDLKGEVSEIANVNSNVPILVTLQ